MKKSTHFSIFKILVPVLVICLISTSAMAQRDTVAVSKSDSQQLEEDEKKEKKGRRKRKNEIKIYAGANISKLMVPAGEYESTFGLGYNLGASYKQGRFFYWEAGLRFNNAVFGLKDLKPADSTTNNDGTFGIRSVDVPITGGINFLSIVSRIVGLRVFVSAVPSFRVGVGGNSLGIENANTNGFNLLGQAGVGLDVLFLVFEAGFNYGFMDVSKDFHSNPAQIYINLGFRF